MASTGLSRNLQTLPDSIITALPLPATTLFFQILEPTCSPPTDINRRLACQNVTPDPK